MRLLTCLPKKILLLTVLMVSIILLASWSMPLTSNMFTEYLNHYDTLPQSHEQRITDLNEAIVRLEKAKEELEDRDISREIAAALKKVNLERVQLEVDKAMRETSLALQNTDLSCVKAKVKQALAGIDMDKINEQVKLATEQLQPEIERAVAATKRQIEEAQQEVDNAKKELRRKRATVL